MRTPKDPLGEVNAALLSGDREADKPEGFKDVLLGLPASVLAILLGFLWIDVASLWHSPPTSLCPHKGLRAAFSHESHPFHITSLWIFFSVGDSQALGMLFTTPAGVGQLRGPLGSRSKCHFAFWGVLEAETHAVPTTSMLFGAFSFAYRQTILKLLPSCSMYTKLPSPLSELREDQIILLSEAKGS